MLYVSEGNTKQFYMLKTSMKTSIDLASSSHNWSWKIVKIVKITLFWIALSFNILVEFMLQQTTCRIGCVWQMMIQSWSCQMCARTAAMVAVICRWSNVTQATFTDMHLAMDTLMSWVNKMCFNSYTLVYADANEMDCHQIP